MNVQKVIAELQEKYPGKPILKNNEEHPTEIVCEIEPTSEHPDYSTAVAVIDESIPHYHKKTTEEYKILKGTLVLFLDDKQIALYENDAYIITPGIKHYAKGQETWITTTARPGWTKEDHIFV